jgi:hypothetical protein
LVVTRGVLTTIGCNPEDLAVSAGCENRGFRANRNKFTFALAEHYSADAASVFQQKLGCNRLIDK